MRLRERILAYLLNIQHKIENEVDDTPPEFYEKVMKELEKDCSICIHYGSKSCPNSAECYATKDKPYFVPKCDGWICGLRDWYKKRRADRRWRRLAKRQLRSGHGITGHACGCNSRKIVKDAYFGPLRCEVCGAYLERDGNGEYRCLSCNPPGFDVGDAVRFKCDGTKATVTKIGDGYIEVQDGNGNISACHEWDIEKIEVYQYGRT